MWWTQPQTPLRGLAHCAFQPSHCFQLNQLPCKHMGNRWVFLFSCRSRVLNNIQKDSATYHTTLAKIWSAFFCLFFFPSLPSQQFSPLQFGKRARRWKGTDTQCSNLDKVWLALIKVIEQTEKNGKHRAKTVTAFQEAANGNISNTMALKSSTKRRQWCGVWLTQIDMSSLT